MEAMISKPTNDQKRPRPQKEKALNCPRCNSTNTKFCYYNNYSLSQPRYFCKSCRRYWTEGGSLRNVPVGGESRKNKRSSSSSSTQVSSKIFPDFPPEIFSSQNPKNDHEGQNLNNFFMPNNGFSSSGILSMQEFNYSLDGFGNGYMQGGVQENSTRVFLSFEDLKQESSTSEFEKKQGEARSGH